MNGNKLSSESEEVFARPPRLGPNIVATPMTRSVQHRLSLTIGGEGEGHRLSLTIRVRDTDSSLTMRVGGTISV